MGSSVGEDSETGEEDDEEESEEEGEEEDDEEAADHEAEAEEAVRAVLLDVGMAVGSAYDGDGPVAVQDPYQLQVRRRCESSAARGDSRVARGQARALGFHRSGWIVATPETQATFNGLPINRSPCTRHGL